MKDIFTSILRNMINASIWFKIAIIVTIIMTIIFYFINKRRLRKIAFTNSVETEYYYGKPIRYGFFIILILFVCMVSTESYRETQMYKDALELRENKRYDEALEIFNELAKEIPGYYFYYYELAKTYYDAEDYQNAKEMCMKAISCKKNSDCYDLYGDVLYQLQMYEDALEQHRIAYKINNNTNYHIHAANDLLKLCRYYEAALIYEEEKKNLNSVLDYINYGICLFMKEDYEKALYEFQCARNLDSEYKNIGENLKHLELEKQIVKDDELENSIHLQYEFGKVFYSLNYYNEALSAFKIAAESDKENKLVYYYIGECLNKLDRKDEAKRYYSKAMVMELDEQLYQQQLFLLEAYNLAYEMQDDIEAQFDYAYALIESDKYEEASLQIDLAENIDKKSETDNTEKINKYRFLIEQKKEVEVDKFNDEAHYLLGNAYYNLEIFEAAEKEFRTAIQINADVSAYHNDLGCALNKMGQFTYALEEFEAAYSIREDDFYLEQIEITKRKIARQHANGG